jgi:hypothetical protein
MADNQVWKTAKPFVNGGLSGMAATCIIQPIDMVKVRIQLGAKGGPVSGGAVCEWGGPGLAAGSHGMAAACVIWPGAKGSQGSIHTRDDFVPYHWPSGPHPAPSKR